MMVIYLIILYALSIAVFNPVFLGINLSNIIIIVEFLGLIVVKNINLKIKISMDISILLYIFFLLLSISITYSPDKFTALLELLRLLMIIIFYFIFNNYIKNELDLKKYIKVLVITTFILSIYCIVQKELGLSEYYLDYGITNTKRIIGTFKEPNVLASYISLIIPFIILYITSANGINKLIGVITVILSSYVLYYTYSRWAIISCILGFILVIPVLETRKKKLELKKSKYIIVILVTIMIILVFYRYSELINNIIESLFNKRDSTSYRIESTISALKIAFNSIIGIGLANKQNMVLDGSYINLLLQSGIASFLTYILILVLIFKKLYRNCKREKNFKINLYTLISFVIFIINSIGESIIYNTNTNVFLGLYISICYFNINNLQGDKNEESISN